MACRLIETSLGYPVATYAVRTVDAYIITLIRIPRVESSRVVVFQHGLLDSASAWVSTGNLHALASRAWAGGADVFLINLRGTNDALDANGLGGSSSGDENAYDYGYDYSAAASTEEGGRRGISAAGAAAYDPEQSGDESEQDDEFEEEEEEAMGGITGGGDTFDGGAAISAKGNSMIAAPTPAAAPSPPSTPAAASPTLYSPSGSGSGMRRSASTDAQLHLTHPRRRHHHAHRISGPGVGERGGADGGRAASSFSSASHHSPWPTPTRGLLATGGAMLLRIAAEQLLPSPERSVNTTAATTVTTTANASASGVPPSFPQSKGSGGGSGGGAGARSLLTGFGAGGGILKSPSAPTLGGSSSSSSLTTSLTPPSRRWRNRSGSPHGDSERAVSGSGTLHAITSRGPVSSSSSSSSAVAPLLIARSTAAASAAVDATTGGGIGIIGRTKVRGRAATTLPFGVDGPPLLSTTGYGVGSGGGNALPAQSSLPRPQQELLASSHHRRAGTQLQPQPQGGSGVRPPLAGHMIVKSSGSGGSSSCSGDSGYVGSSSSSEGGVTDVMVGVSSGGMFDHQRRSHGVDTASAATQPSSSSQRRYSTLVHPLSSGATEAGQNDSPRKPRHRRRLRLHPDATQTVETPPTTAALPTAPPVTAARVHETLQPRQREFFQYNVSDHVLDVMAALRAIRAVKEEEAPLRLLQRGQRGGLEGAGVGGAEGADDDAAVAAPAASSGAQCVVGAAPPAPSSSPIPPAAIQAAPPLSATQALLSLSASGGVRTSSIGGVRESRGHPSTPHLTSGARLSEIADALLLKGEAASVSGGGVGRAMTGEISAGITGGGSTATRLTSGAVSHAAGAAAPTTTTSDASNSTSASPNGGNAATHDDDGDDDTVRITGIGHSMGATILLLTVLHCRALGRPHGLSKLVLLSPAGLHAHMKVGKQ